MNNKLVIGEYRCGWVSYGWSYAKVKLQRRVTFLHFWKRWQTISLYGRGLLYARMRDAYPQDLVTQYKAAIADYEAWCAAWSKGLLP